MYKTDISYKFYLIEIDVSLFEFLLSTLTSLTNKCGICAMSLFSLREKILEVNCM